MTPDKKKEKPEAPPNPPKPQKPEPEKWPAPLPADHDSLQNVERRDVEETIKQDKHAGNL